MSSWPKYNYIKMSYNYSSVEIYKDPKNQKLFYRSHIGKSGKYFDTEREAAVHVDKMLINKGKEPRNILVRKLA